MPLFGRPDGTLVKDLSPVRYIMPFVMVGRNESVIFHEESYDISRTRVWLREFNRAHPDMPTVGLFQLILWACAQGLWRRPGLNRFLSGKRMYQRKGVWITFAAKQRMADDAPLITVKLPFYENEPFGACAARIASAVVDGKGGKAQMVDKELALAQRLPVWLLSAIMGLLRWLDRVNLMPAFMIESDPLYTSLFLTNLGSVGLDRTYHHLYESGNCPLFGVVGTPRKATVTERGGREALKDTLEIRWTLDERVNDGFYCAASLKLFKKIIESPDSYIGDPITLDLNSPPLMAAAAPNRAPAALPAPASSEAAQPVTSS